MKFRLPSRNSSRYIPRSSVAGLSFHRFRSITAASASNIMISPLSLFLRPDWMKQSRGPFWRDSQTILANVLVTQVAVGAAERLAAAMASHLTFAFLATAQSLDRLSPELLENAATSHARPQSSPSTSPRHPPILVPHRQAADERARLHRAAEQITLQPVATDRAQEGRLRRCLHTLGCHIHAERMRHRHNGMCDRD